MLGCVEREAFLSLIPNFSVELHSREGAVAKQKMEILWESFLRTRVMSQHSLFQERNQHNHKSTNFIEAVGNGGTGRS